MIEITEDDFQEELLMLREHIARKIEEACKSYTCSRVATNVCSCAMAAHIARHE